MNTRIPPPSNVPTPAREGTIRTVGWQRWSAVFQAQFRLLNRLTLLSRHAAGETQSARSPLELFSIQMNLQKALVLDCTAFATDCLRAVSGLPLERSGVDGHQPRSPGEAVAPVVGAITEPIIEGMQAALFAAASTPAAAFASQAPPPAEPTAPDREPPGRCRATRKRQPHAWG
ncbi:hypothetical protein EZ313_03110 [Ramlibacter henchirensis]|uniref:Phasin family protein n=1 Tax=Ramlibacter henchirensis TaxID=204072 RepID=A0A4Z0C5P3_9BURK|nr:hypothetical protein [Ramlibacter henchirensis]TFZ05668.1 hypothetical protein EZ313_03110 [Ramlibacter henchirensis]